MKNEMNIEFNPATLAAVRAEHLAITEDVFGASQEEARALVELEAVAEVLGMTQKMYFVESNRSLAIPLARDSSEEVTYINFMGLTFEGNFVTYSKVAIGRIAGAQAVRALCLTFNEVTLLPFFDELPDDHLLHVPVLAVASMSQQAA